MSCSARRADTIQRVKVITGKIIGVIPIRSLPFKFIYAILVAYNIAFFLHLYPGQRIRITTLTENKVADIFRLSRCTPIIEKIRSFHVASILNLSILQTCNQSESRAAIGSIQTICLVSHDIAHGSLH